MNLEEIRRQNARLNKKLGSSTSNNKPTVITVSGATKEKIIRRHSLRPRVRAILEKVRNTEITAIGLLGSPGSGKTTFSRSLYHLIHELKPADMKFFEYHLLNKNDMVNFADTLNKLNPNVNQVLAFDDVSYAAAYASHSAILQFQNQITEARHLRTGDTRMILIFNFHALKGIPKMLRGVISDWYLFSLTNPQIEDLRNELQIKKHERALKDFAKSFAIATGSRDKLFKFKLGPDKIFTYRYKSPFVPLLHFDQSNMTYAIFGKWSWYTPDCRICRRHDPELVVQDDPSDLISFKNELENYAKSPTSVKPALKMVLYGRGVDHYKSKHRALMTKLNRLSTPELKRLWDEYDK